MIARILLTFAVLTFALLIPILEINASHVFNDRWPAHARFHEVWQLTTNFGIGLLCLWLVWFKNRISLASILVTLVMGGMLFAYATQDMYGGSVLSGNFSKKVLGIELAVVITSLAVIMAMVATMLNARDKH